LVYWFIGLLVYWFIGLLVYWFIGLLVYWFIGLSLWQYHNRVCNQASISIFCFLRPSVQEQIRFLEFSGKPPALPRRHKM